MDSSKSSSLLLVALLLLRGRCESSIFQKHKTHVLIRNDMQEQLDMTVRCKSKDDDLGVHVIPPGGSYGFNFRPNFFCTTLFWCNFEWPGASRGYKVYDCQRDYDRCFDCTWSIKSSSPCLYNAKTSQYDLCDNW
ncbi:S-protein homolog 2-like [Punica granatum]|uniref:S-protein homolog 2-like n=2 Tax=Punica granatum TaxID=22663 RepID=A0A6P8D4R4_PUNGR|nr:S-protein homolog 2-like [Punica granatum]PKI79227.1 hypothetical protein CRG98_000347 [Punica granatum]